MTTSFTVSHAGDARFVAGLRSFFEYRDLASAATEGRVAAHVIRALTGAPVRRRAAPSRRDVPAVYV